MTKEDMESRPTVSVVIPFLDPPEAFFREAIGSVLAQSFEDWELLLVNDGSEPEVTATARAFVRSHPERIRLLEHPGGSNRGLSAARNLGIKRAQGCYVAFLDADDVWSGTRLTKHVELLEKFPGAAMVCGPSLYWSSWDLEAESDSNGGDWVPGLGVPVERELAPPGILPVFLVGRGAVPCPSAITIRRTSVLEVGGFEEEFRGLYEDQVFYAKMLLVHPMVATDRVLDRYRQNPRSMTASAGTREEAEARKRFLRWLLDHIDTLERAEDDLRGIVARELWAVEHPVGGRALRMLRRLGAPV